MWVYFYFIILCGFVFFLFFVIFYLFKGVVTAFGDVPHPTLAYAISGSGLHILMNLI